MAKLKCPCGNLLSNVSSPSQNNGILLRDDDLCSLDKALEVGMYVWECHDCGRIGVTKSDDVCVKWYSPDDGKPGNLMTFE